MSTSGPSIDESLDRCIEALMAVKFARKTHASGPAAKLRIEQIAGDLACYRSEMGKYGGIAQQVADAIHRGILNHEPPTRQPEP